MSFRDRLVRLAALKLLTDEIKKTVDADKAALFDDVGGRMGGTGAVVDGKEIGTVSIAEGRDESGSHAGWVVYDPVAFVKWTKANYPTAVIETVRDSDRKMILASIEKWSAEGKDVPDGVKPAQKGDPYVVVNQTAEQRENAVRAYREGRLVLPEMAPQIEEAPDE